MSFGASADAKGGPMTVVCSIPTGIYGTGFAVDTDARLSGNPHRSTLSCAATISDPLPDTTVTLTGLDTGLPCIANGAETSDWEVKISSNGRVTMKCTFVLP
jgi:hypothetical protein